MIRDYQLAQVNIGRLIAPVDDPRVIVNMSVWESIEALRLHLCLRSP
jgi:hypothetical protein